MEVNCDAYFAKIQEIQNQSLNVNCTLTQITTLLNDLETIEDNIDNDISSMSIPSSFSHLNKYILLMIDRENKSNLQKILLNLVDIRTANVSSYQLSNPYEDLCSYTNETAQIAQFVENEMDNCNCMSTRKILVKKLSKK